VQDLLTAVAFARADAETKSVQLVASGKPGAAAVLARALSGDAIDRAGSTAPDKIQAALKATDLKPDQLIMGYRGVKFDDKGQNILASAVIIQLQDGENYVAVWPKANAVKEPIVPYKGW